MDPVTHVLLGGVTGCALFGRRLRWHAVALGALAAIAPDIDVLIQNGRDALASVEFHRSFTHSLLFSFLGSFALAAFWFLRPGFRNQWPALWACAWTAWVTHCLLDAATTYGTQLF